MELQPKIPFCRKAHAQVTARVGTSEAILVFGGIGLDYTETSASGYLADLWSLNLVQQSFLWNEVFPVPGRQWPEQRKNFGYAVTQREGWLLVHGGEAFAASNILGDLWLHKDGNWICLDDASASASSAPAPRKNHALAVLPRSGQLFLMGGNGMIQKHGEQGTICHSDAYLLSLNAVLEGVADSGLEARARNASASTSWRAAASFPVPPRMRCFEGFSAVGVVDASSWERREKVLVFGGRYTTSETRRRLSSAGVASSSSATVTAAAARRTASSSSSSSSSAGSGSGSSSGNVTKVVREESHYAYSNQAWLYDPLDNEWTRLLPDVEGLPMPIGRDRHACAYVRELDTVFVSGGRSYTTPLEASRRDAKSGAGSASGGSGSAGDNVSGSGNGTSGLSNRESQASTIMDLWGFNLSSRTWTEYSRGGEEGGGPGDEAGQVGQAGARALSRRQGGRALGSPRPRVPAARYEHTMSIWRGASGREAPQLVLFGGQHELRHSSISALGRRLGSHSTSDPAAPALEGAAASASLQAEDSRHGGKSSWGILSDDDSYGAIGKHSQLNDLWAFALPLPAAQGGQGAQGPRQAWRLVSVGGCSSGDNGLLDTKPAIDVTAVIFVCAIAGAFLIGILAHRGMLHLTRFLRGGAGYEQIDDDERKAGMGAAPHGSTHGGVQMGPAGPLGQSVLGSPRRASPTLQRSMAAGQGQGQGQAARG